MAAVTADWSSIYMGLTSSSCLGCHGGDGAVGGGFMLGMDACSSYHNVFNQAAKTTIGMPSCAASGMLLVVPNMPDASLLVKKLEGTQMCGSPTLAGHHGPRRQRSDGDRAAHLDHERRDAAARMSVAKARAVPCAR